MRTSDFDYDLPEELIAQYPAEKRDESRMLLLDRSREEVRETRFSNFARYLQEGDMVVVNDSRVIPARLLGTKAATAAKDTGGSADSDGGAEGITEEGAAIVDAYATDEGEEGAAEEAPTEEADEEEEKAE